MEKAASRSKRIIPRQSLFLAIPALLFLLLAIFSRTLSQNDSYTRKDVRYFEKVLHRKEKILEREFVQLQELFRQEDPLEVLERRAEDYFKLAETEGISIYYYTGDQLAYWSDHTVALPPFWNKRMNRYFSSLRNADYVTVVKHVGRDKLLGLVEIRTHYPFQNKYLNNDFRKEFRLQADVSIEFFEADGSYPVYNSQGEYIFSLDFSGAEPGSEGLRILSMASLFLFLAFFFAMFCSLLRTSHGWKRGIWLGLISILVLLINVLLIRYSFPRLLTETPLFQPELFASHLFPSLGILLSSTLSVLVLVSLYYMYSGVEHIQKPLMRKILVMLFFTLAAFILPAIEQLIRILVLDSSISFEAHRVTTFSAFTILGLLIVVMAFIILGLFMDKALVMWGGSLRSAFFAGIICLSVATLVQALFFPELFSWLNGIALWLLLSGQLYLRARPGDKLSFSRYIFLLFFITAYMSFHFQENNHIQKERKREVELVKLSSEHDPVAEMLFSEMSMAMRNDSVLITLLNRPETPIDAIINRLQRNYFSGYWNKYDLQVVVCGPEDPVYLRPPDDEWVPCYPFFDELILEGGLAVPGSDFYFLDKLNGRISYLAFIPYMSDFGEQRMYIELDSKIFSNELGYPELLLNDDYSSPLSSSFSFARYNQGELISRMGDYPYRLSSEFYTRGEDEFETIELNHFDHSIYNVDEQNTIIVGSPSITLVDQLISFSYMFTLNFLLLALVYLLFTVRILHPSFNWNFKNRIQYSMVGILFFTFVLICSGTIFFIIQQYRVKDYDNLRNIMRSVNIELIHKLEFENNLEGWSSESYYNLDELLQKFSNVFYTDINLYDRDGYLLASSRNEIFNRRLLSRRMNRQVFESLDRNSASEYIHDERIGNLRYLSAYIPLFNTDNQLLAYLNLPYFTQSEALARDLTNLVVAIINIYMILMLVILLISVLLAERITQPLRLLQERIARVSLSEKNEMIHYDRSDEIRGLVEEYNSMVEELERSASLLAQSERESAWREMAKQIAHEIKNPLTPMKLNVQHLQRSLSEGKLDTEQVSRMAELLIEQIDSLSSIAREFSDFAKMPRATLSRLNLVSKLKSLLQLFDSTDKVRISLELDEKKDLWVMADKEQLMRVFINLLKNGIQSIPEGREGQIRIRLLQVDERRVHVSFKDNGKGIPDEIRDKLFQPNFTTKSRGMGMGLAISYNIIRSFGGKIWYDTVLHQGTTFWVELPLMAEKRRPNS